MSELPAPRDGADDVHATDFVDPSVLEEVLNLTWSTFVDPEGELIPAAPVSEEVRGMVAEIGVTGRAPVQVRLSIDQPGAWSVTERMTIGTGLVVGDEDVRDAIGELANVLGGNLKALFPEGSHLTLPKVAEGPLAPGPLGPDDISTAVWWGEHLVTATVAAPARGSRS